MTTEKKEVLDHIQALLRLGIPLVGANLAGFAIHLTDTLMLGRYDVTALAAATVATSIYFVVFMLGSGFGVAVLPIVASAVAAGDEVLARRATRMSMWLGVIFFACAFPLLWWSEFLMKLLGQTPMVAQLAQDYLRIAVFGMLPALVLMSLRSFLSALGHTKIQLIVTTGGILLNVFINYLLIFGTFGFPELGIRGAAIASVFVQLGMVSANILYVSVKERRFQLFIRIWRPDWELLRKVAGMGFPIGLTSLAEGGMFSASAIMMGWIGEIELAAHGIALQLTALTFMFHVGMSQAATVLAGRAYGSKNEEELRDVAKAAIIIAGFFGVIVICIFCVFPSQLVGLFLDPNEARIVELLAIGTTLVIVSTMFQFVDSGQIVALSLLRGVHDTTVPMWLAVGSYWIIGLASSYILAFVFGLGAVGLWFGLSAGLGAAAFSMMARFWGHSVKIGTQ